jgi:hypothetical protein
MTNKDATNNENILDSPAYRQAVVFTGMTSIGGLVIPAEAGIQGSICVLNLDNQFDLDFINN